MATPSGVSAVASRPKIKCVLWDLDNSLWDGVLLEGGASRLRANVLDAIQELDRVGILQSVVSRNDYRAAMSRLREFGIDEYFLYPQIGWAAKSEGVAKIAERLNMGIDSFAFIDDQEFERDEITFVHPSVACFDSTNISAILDDPRIRRSDVTPEAANRRTLYLADMRRNEAEESFTGPKEEFLTGLRMKFRIFHPGQADLPRAAELVERTNQLNTTGYRYSYQEIECLLSSPDHYLVLASLDDRYGSYGTIGAAVAEFASDSLTLRLLLLSCRVMSRGLGMVLLLHLINVARKRRLRFFAEFIPNERNRMMYVTYKFSGLVEHERHGKVVILAHDGDSVPAYPSYIEVIEP